MPGAGSLPFDLAREPLQASTPKLKVFAAGGSGQLPSGSRPWDVEAAPDGTMWFSDPALGAVGTISPGGAVHEYARGLPHGSRPFAVAPQSATAAWFTDPANAAVGSIANGKARELHDPRLIPTVVTGLTLVGSTPWFVAERNFAAYGKGPSYLGRVAGNRLVLRTLLPSSGVIPDGSITSDASGNVWFLAVDASGAANVVQTRLDGALVPHSTGIVAGAEPCCPNQAPRRLQIGSDGNPWFTTLYYARPKGRFGPVETVTPAGPKFFPLSGAGGFASGVAARGHAWWFSGASPFQISGTLWNVDYSGRVVSWFTVPYAPAALAVDPSGNLWFTSSPGGDPGENGVLVEVPCARCATREL